MKICNSIRAVMFALLLSTLNQQLSNAFAQGVLTPPGAPAPVMKSLDQIEPRTIVNAANTPGDVSDVFIITNSGSYYLATNVIGVGGKNGILINANNVTLDLNGYALLGTPSSLDGVEVGLSLANIIVRNGTISGWGGTGMDGYSQGYPRNIVYEKLVIAGNAWGIYAEADSTIRDCEVRNNTQDGIASVGSLVTGCIARDNSGHGINVYNSTVRSCSIQFNATGILADHSTVADCDIIQNSANGIILGSVCQVLNNRIADNIGSGSAITINGALNYIAGNAILNNSFGLVGNAAGCTNNCILQNRFLFSSQTVTSGNNMFPLVELGPVSGGAFASTNSFDNIIYP